MNSLGATAGLLFTGSGLAAAAEQATDSDLSGIAAIIAASAGMVSALGALYIAARPKSRGSSADQAKDELLLELLKEKLERERDEDQP